MKIQNHKAIKAAKRALIKVRLDSKTFISIHRESSLKVWLKKYPNAEVIAG